MKDKLFLLFVLLLVTVAFASETDLVPTIIDDRFIIDYDTVFGDEIDENVALNVLVGFVNLAQKRGVFNVQESAKIWEAIQTFMKKQ